MKLLQQKIVPDQPGSVKMVPEDLDDLWLVYNLISAGDFITADTTRKVHGLSAVSGAKKNPSRVKIELEIKITLVEYRKNSSLLRVSGESLVSNDYIKVGMFHTLELEVNKEFNLRKKIWNDESICSLKEASSGGSATADLSVVLLDDGMAHLFLIGKSLTTLRASIYVSETGSNRFLETVFRAFLKYVDFETIRCVVIGSNGPTKEEFRRYVLSEAQGQKIKSILNNKSRLLLLRTSSANEASLKEVLQDEKVITVIRGTNFAIELKAYKEFTDLLVSNPDRACYGPKSVETAHELAAVDTLLITEELFNSAEIKTRHKYAELVKSVKKSGGKTFVFPPAHVYGKQLAHLTGIAAVLRYP